MNKIVEIKNEKENNINKNKYKNINLGIELLRAYMSFSIVILHFLKEEFKTNFLLKFMFHCQPFYVPTFFLISFYFSFNMFISKNIAKIKERFIRILIPYTIWPIFLWLRNIIFNHKDINFDYAMFKPILFQLLIGYDFYAVFWFQFDLIVITIIFSIIIFSFDTHYFIILKFMSVFLYIINKTYEERLIIYKQIGSIKPLFGSFIYSFAGFYLRSKSILIKFHIKRNVIFILIIISFFLIYIHKILIKISIRFKIAVVDIVIVCLFIFFGKIPFDSIQNDIIKKIIKQLTSYTGGIYYIHYGVRKIFSTYFPIFNVGNFKACIINYIVCYLICFIGSTLFKKTKLKFLFL